MNEIDTIKTWLGTGSLNLFGLPFAGKDTQCDRLAETLNGVLISGGDILRHSTENEEVQRIMAAGDIIPTDLFKTLVIPFLEKPDNADRPLILSEVGRMDGEQHAVLAAAQESNHPVRAVIFLTMPSEEVFKRFHASQATHDRGDRADDRKEVLHERIDAFNEKVMPVIDFYRQSGLLIEIDGTQSKDEVTAAIFAALAQRATT
jgi:adenylate kinase